MVSGRVGIPLTTFPHTSWVVVVTPTDRPKSVHNRCVIEVFDGVFVLSRCFLKIFCGCRGFCHRAESDLFLFSFVTFDRILRGRIIFTLLKEKREEI